MSAHLKSTFSDLNQQEKMLKMRILNTGENLRMHKKNRNSDFYLKVSSPLRNSCQFLKTFIRYTRSLRKKNLSKKSSYLAKRIIFEK